MISNEKQIAEKTFTKIDEMMYNIGREKFEGQLKSEHYLPTNDVAFKKMLASNENIHISEGFLNDLAMHDPLGALEIGGVEIETPYNFKDANQLKAQEEKYKTGVLYTEVDYACRDPKGSRFVIEMQMRGESHLEKRVAYNVAEKYTSMYAGVEKGLIKYDSLKPVISIVILKESYFKEDDIPIRYLRHHDARYDLYKRDLHMGLEIYIELDKDVSNLPQNLQNVFQFFKTGKVPKGAQKYLKEAADRMKKINFTPEERKLADFYIRAQLKRESEDAYVQEQSLEKGFKQGIEQGIEQGIKQGIKQGIEQGRQVEREKAGKDKLDTARKLLSRGMRVGDIAEDLGLDIEIVSTLPNGH